MNQSFPEYRFGRFRVLSGGRALLRDGETVPLSPKALAVLVELLREPGQVVSKAEMLERVWAGSFVEDGNLSQTIFILRKAFAADFPESPIETLPRSGYRFRAPVEAAETISVTPPPEPPPQPVAEGNQPAAVTQQAPPASSPPRHATLAGWVTGAVLVLICLAVFIHRTRVSAAAGNRAVPSFHLQRLTDKESEDRITAAAISPDGSQIVYADSDGVVLQRIGSEATLPINAPAMNGVYRLAWFPDNRHLLVSGTESRSHTSAIWKLSLAGDAPQLLKQDAWEGVPSPDGSRVAFTTDGKAELWISGPAGEAPKRLVAAVPGDTFPVLLWSRDGSSLLLDRHRQTFANVDPSNSANAQNTFHADYLAVNAADGSVTAEKQELYFSTACLMPDNRLLFTQTTGYPKPSKTRTWSVQIDPKSGAFISEPVDIGLDDGILQLSSDQSGNRAVALVLSARSGVFVGSWHDAGSKLDGITRLSFEQSNAYMHAWTKDSNSVLYESSRSGRIQIFRQRLGHYDAQAVASTTQSEVYPRESPDGRWILFSTKPAGQESPSYQFFRVPADAVGAKPVSIPTGPTSGQYRCAITGALCVLRDDDGHGRIVYYKLDPVAGRGSELYSQPLPADTGDWDLSPDGTALAMTVPASLRPILRVVSFGRGEGHIVTEDIPVSTSGAPTAVNWSSDGKGFFVGVNTAVGSDLFFVNLQGKAKLIRQIAGPTWGVPSPDGRKLAFLDHIVDSNVWLLRPQ
jgi:Tol biopolymer transport system component/DNA-binding winged helix-turn-helix (wHTH) protein